MTQPFAKIPYERTARIQRRGWQLLVSRAWMAQRTARRLFGSVPMLAQDLFDGEVLFTIFVDGRRFSVLDKYGNVEARP